MALNGLKNRKERKERKILTKAVCINIQEKCEISSLGYAFASDLKERIQEISKFRFYILTDQIISTRVKRIEKDDISGKKVELNVWDISRLYAIAQSNMEKENIRKTN